MSFVWMHTLKHGIGTTVQVCLLRAVSVRRCTAWPTLCNALIAKNPFWSIAIHRCQHSMACDPRDLVGPGLAHPGVRHRVRPGAILRSRNLAPHWLRPRAARQQQIRHNSAQNRLRPRALPMRPIRCPLRSLRRMLCCRRLLPLRRVLSR